MPEAAGTPPGHVSILVTFLVAVTRYRTRSNLKKKGFLLTRGLRGKETPGELEAAGYIVITVRKQRDAGTKQRDVGTKLASSRFPFYFTWNPSPQDSIVLPVFRVSLSSSMKPLCKHTHRHAKHPHNIFIMQPIQRETQRDSQPASQKHTHTHTLRNKNRERQRGTER